MATRKPQTPPPSTVHPLFRWAPYLVLLISAGLYLPTIGFDYTQDDAIVITDNMYTSDGIKGIPGILGKDTFYGFFKQEGKANLVAGGRYRPLSLVLFAVERSIFGPKPWAGHLFNGLWYALACLMVYLLLQNWLKAFFGKKSGDKAPWIALAAALLFASHPVHTEVVANIKGRDEILSLLGGLTAAWCLSKAVQQEKLGILPYVLAGAALFLGLMSKETALPMVVLIPLGLYTFLRVSPGRAAAASIPLWAGAAAFLVIRFSVLGFGLGEPSLELMNNPFLKLQGNTWVAFTTGEKWSTIFYSLGKYLQLLVWPHPLTHDYYPRQIDLTPWSHPQVLLSLLVHVGLLGYAIWSLPKRSLLGFCIWWYLGTLFLVSNLLFPVGVHVAERFLFAPSLGFALALGYGLSKLNRNAGWGLLLLFLLGYAGKTLSRSQVWKDNYTLFTTDIKTSPNSAKLRNAVGGELTTQAGKMEDINRRQALAKEAIGHLEEAVRLHPTYKNAYLLLGNAYIYLDQYDKSIEYYQRALQLDPEFADARNNLGIAYREAGRFAGEKQGNLALALDYLQKAVQYQQPADVETLRLLGVAYGMQGNAAQAIEWFTKAVQTAPQNAAALFDLGTAYYNAGDPATGARYHEEARKIDPNVGSGSGR